MTLKQATAVMLFYRYYWPLPTAMTTLCCYIYKVNEESIFLAVACKLATDIAIWYFITTLYNQRLYYYYNLHISKRLLMFSFFTTDLILLCTSLWIIHLF